MITRFDVLSLFNSAINFKTWFWVGLIVGTCFFGAVVTEAGLSFVGNGYVILDANGGGNNFYNVDNSSDSSTPSYSGNLGNLTIQQGQSLYIGGEVQTYPNEYGTSAWIGYNLYNSVGTLVSSSSGISLGYVGSAPYPNGNNASWETLASSSGVNLDNSLSAGTYYLDVYFGAYNSDAGNIYDSNNRNNYDASFNISAVPEPVTLALPIFGGLVATAGLARRFIPRQSNQVG